MESSIFDPPSSIFEMSQDDLAQWLETGFLLWSAPATQGVAFAPAVLRRDVALLPQIERIFDRMGAPQKILFKGAICDVTAARRLTDNDDFIILQYAVGLASRLRAITVIRYLRPLLLYGPLARPASQNIRDVVHEVMQSVVSMMPADAAYDLIQDYLHTPTRCTELDPLLLIACCEVEPDNWTAYVTRYDAVRPSLEPDDTAMMAFCVTLADVIGMRRLADGLWKLPFSQNGANVKWLLSCLFGRPESPLRILRSAELEENVDEPWWITECPEAETHLTSSTLVPIAMHGLNTYHYSLLDESLADAWKEKRLQHLPTAREVDMTLHRVLEFA